MRSRKGRKWFQSITSDNSTSLDRLNIRMTILDKLSDNLFGDKNRIFVIKNRVRNFEVL